MIDYCNASSTPFPIELSWPKCPSCRVYSFRLPPQLHLPADLLYTFHPSTQLYKVSVSSPSVLPTERSFYFPFVRSLSRSTCLRALLALFNLTLSTRSHSTPTIPSNQRRIYYSRKLCRPFLDCVTAEGSELAYPGLDGYVSRCAGWAFVTTTCVSKPRLSNEGSEIEESI